MSLILRIAAAVEPDRELDAEILRQTGGSDIRWVGNGDGVWRNMTIYTVSHERNPLPREVPRYTSSIDAAMTLVPEGWFTFLAGEDRHSHSWIWHLRGGFGVDAACRAATPALALCAAALKSRAIIQGETA